MTKKVLVTGSEGSLMQAVIPHLVNRGYEVVGVDNLSRYGERRNLAKVKYDFHKFDLIHPNVVDILIREVQPDFIIQGAAKIFGVGGFTAHGADILGDDVSLHTNILRSAHKAACVKRVVYISSSMVYETSNISEEFGVDQAPIHKTEYGLSKYVGERLSKAYWEQYKLPYTIWRPFNIITPFERAEGEIGTSHVFADFINSIVVNKNKNVPIIGNGYQVRCFTDIRDVSATIAEMSFDVTTLNSVFNIGSTEAVNMRNLAYRIAHHAHQKKLIDFSENDLTFTTVKEYPNDVKLRVPNVRAAENILNWNPKYSLDDSINYCLENLKNG